jgi:ubiquitin carboxyl-terminal hydrolase 36/42
METDFDTVGWSADVQSGHADPEEQAAWIFGAMRAVIPSSSFASLESFTQITTTSAIRCKCGHESRTEGHSDHALPVPITPRIQNGTLAHYLHKYMVEVIEGYRCEMCKDESRKHRKQLIGHAPNILAVQLKRFNWNGSKDNSPITINTTLNLDQYRDTSNRDHLAYELTAMVKHAGSTNSGHYICSAKGPNGAWYCFDDDRVSKSSVSDATSSKSRFTPYLLFFQRKET